MQMRYREDSRKENPCFNLIATNAYLNTVMQFIIQISKQCMTIHINVCISLGKQQDDEQTSATKVTMMVTNVCSCNG